MPECVGSLQQLGASQQQLPGQARQTCLHPERRKIVVTANGFSGDARLGSFFSVLIFFITPDGGIVHRLGDVAVYYEDCRSRLARDRSARTAGHSKLMDVERSQGGRGQTRSPVQAGSAMVLHATCWTWERVDKRRKCRV